MSGMLYLHYDEETGAPLGFYTQDRNAYIPKPAIEINSEIRNRVRKNPKLYKVLDGKIIEREDYAPEFTQESLVLQEYEDVQAKLTDLKKVGKYRYIFDQTAQLNIILGYMATESNKKSVKLWCVDESGEWVFAKHGKRELAELAAAFTTLRENESTKLHERLDTLNSENDA